MLLGQWARLDIFRMPLMNLDAPQTEAAMASGASDLKWLMSDCEVPEAVQAVAFHLGFTKVRLFAGLGETRTEVKEAIKAESSQKIELAGRVKSVPFS